MVGVKQVWNGAGAPGFVPVPVLRDGAAEAVRQVWNGAHQAEGWTWTSPS